MLSPTLALASIRTCALHPQAVLLGPGSGQDLSPRCFCSRISLASFLTSKLSPPGYVPDPPGFSRLPQGSQPCSHPAGQAGKDPASRRFINNSHTCGCRRGGPGVLRVETEEPMAAPGLPGRWGGKGRTGHGLGVHLPSATCTGTAGCSQALRATLFSRRAN